MLTCAMRWQHTNFAPDGDQSAPPTAWGRTRTSAIRRAGPYIYAVAAAGETHESAALGAWAVRWSWAFAPPAILSAVPLAACHELRQAQGRSEMTARG